MGFFQNLKEDYAAALDELLGTDSSLPEEEDVDSEAIEEQDDLPPTSMEEAIAEVEADKEPVFQELDLDDLDLEGMEQRILNWNLLKPSEENTSAGASPDDAARNKVNGYEEEAETEEETASEEMPEPAEEAVQAEVSETEKEIVQEKAPEPEEEPVNKEISEPEEKAVREEESEPKMETVHEEVPAAEPMNEQKMIDLISDNRKKLNKMQEELAAKEEDVKKTMMTEQEMLEAMLNEQLEIASGESNSTVIEERSKAVPEGEASEEVAQISKGMKVAGNIRSNGNLDLEGIVVGNITIAGKINIYGEINGDTVAGNVYADGAKIDGSITVSGSVKVAKETVIVGDITASSAVIAGAVKGNIDIHGPVILDSTAIIMGNIKSESLQITTGAVIEGMCSQCYAKVSPASFFEELEKNKED